MRPYFAKMDDIGKPLRPAQKERMKVNVEQIEAIMREIDAEAERIKNFGIGDTYDYACNSRCSIFIARSTIKEEENIHNRSVCF